MTGSFIIGYSIDEPDGKDVLIVGKGSKKDLDIVNAFSDEDARRIFNILKERNRKAE